MNSVEIAARLDRILAEIAALRAEVNELKPDGHVKLHDRTIKDVRKPWELPRV